MSRLAQRQYDRQERLIDFCHNGEMATDAILSESDDPREQSDEPYADQKATLSALWIACLRKSGRFGKEGLQLFLAVMAGHSEYTGGEIEKASEAATDILNPWSRFYEWYGEPAAKYARMFRQELENTAPKSLVLPPLAAAETHLDAGIKAPEWEVDGILARARVHQLSGSWESGKSLFREAMMAASLLGKPFLGRDVPKLKWLILDGEQALADIEVRLLAFGLTDELVKEWVYLIPRETPVKLGLPDGDSRFADAAERFEPDVIWIDSVMRCCVPGISNDDAVRVHDEVFAPLAEEHNAAVVFNHHHTKASGNRSTTSDAALGGTQFTGQADITMTMAQTKAATENPQPDGTILTESHLVFRPSKGSRGNYLTVDHQEPIVVKGVKREDGATVSLSFEHQKAEPTMDERVLSALSDSPLGNTALAETLEVDRTSRALRSAIERLGESNQIVKNDQKNYERTKTT